MQRVESKQRQGLAFPKGQQANSKRRQTLPPPAGPQPVWTVDVPPQTAPRKRGRPRKSMPTPDGRAVNNSNGSQARPQATQQLPTPALVYKKGYDSVRRQQTLQHYQQYIVYGGRPPPTASPQPQYAVPAQAPTGFEYISYLNSEAQVRLALDMIHHSQNSASMKEQHIAALFHKLGQVHMQNGTRQS